MLVKLIFFFLRIVLTFFTILVIICILQTSVFYESGFKRTLCGSKWDPVNGLTGVQSAFYDPPGAKSGAKYGCCPSGKFMSNPEAVPFSEANSCSSSCPVGRVSSSVENDDTSCSCPAGKYGSAVENDQSSCQNCANGMCSAAGSTRCSMCDKLPNGKRFTLFLFFHAFTDCYFFNFFLIFFFWMS